MRRLDLFTFRFVPFFCFLCLSFCFVWFCFAPFEPMSSSFICCFTPFIDSIEKKKNLFLFSFSIVSRSLPSASLRPYRVLPSFTEFFFLDLGSGIKEWSDRSHRAFTEFFFVVWNPGFRRKFSSAYRVVPSFSLIWFFFYFSFFFWWIGTVTSCFRPLLLAFRCVPFSFDFSLFLLLFSLSLSLSLFQRTGNPRLRNLTERFFLGD